MERTYTTTLTPEGRERKIQRLIMEELERKNKKLFARLLAEAEMICAEDDEDPFSKVIAPVADLVIHHVNPLVRARQQLSKRFNSDAAQ